MHTSHFCLLKCLTLISGLDAWKRTYGFDWAEWGVGSGSSLVDSIHYSIKEHCLKEEYGTYAQNCKKNARFFKCGGDV